MRALFFVPFLSGCFAAVDIDVDADGDGAVNSAEEAAGSDPALPDSDGDNWLDGEEIAQSTDPNDGEDHPYTGGWAIDACRDSIESTGNAVGQVAYNFELPDQFGDTVRLHDFCNRVIYLVFGAFW
jgi:hypothetical protein